MARRPQVEASATSHKAKNQNQEFSGLPVKEANHRRQYPVGTRFTKQAPNPKHTNFRVVQNRSTTEQIATRTDSTTEKSHHRKSNSTTAQ
ncbi:hypothetical protein FCM35_KLT17082 [Carex littledalei]|uniref:Uncharacterized protein n=1 Tax=Carex littledalei TaxID=544730 RepID=A0A833R4J4_9POAL|nr:hypothetical protein FCM35_KLT19791 [Carex littledalei]KAF3338245.1 hypothetical protein FCM35_KLT17082 [Carex littledalei]